jgi:hypothetical protein
MTAGKRKVIAIILNDAQNKVGADRIFEISGMKIPKETPEEFYGKSINTVRTLQDKYRKEIEEASR